ncbi:MAG TPA: PKD-like domain-containing protein [Prolixibacteraceae bacterium]|jgi:hypothetical protein
MKTNIFALLLFSSFFILNACSTKDEAPVPPVATATPTAQTIDTGTATSIALSSSVGGTSFSWTVVQSGVSGASAGSGTTISQTLSATGTVAGTATYSIIPTVDGTSGSIVAVTITVKPKVVQGPVPPIATATPSAQTIETGSVTAIALSSSITGTSFSWTVVQSGVSGATSGSGTSISQMLSITGGTTGTATYSIIPSVNGTLGSTVSVTITVNSGKVTYTAQVKPLLTNSCSPCHVAGGSQSSKWDNYTTTKNKITLILDRVQRATTASGFMPQGGTKLSAENIALLNKWVSDGLLEN